MNVYKKYQDALKNCFENVNIIKVNSRMYRGSYMSAHVLLTLLIRLGKRDKM